MAMTSDRTELVGGHVTPAVKEALKKKAAEKNTSVSYLIYEILRKVLKVEPEGGKQQ